MEVLYYRDPKGNFGDDLNEVMWQRLLPATVLERNDLALLGIGSIFNAARARAEVVAGRSVFVLGSGAGYGPLPPDWQKWTILGVRGPLTAELIGRPETAMTDGAALLRFLPDLIRRDPNPDQTLLIPHYHSADRGQWERVAGELGFTYVNPRWSVETVLGHLARAKLVVTEAMHGAIVADTMRIPWIPILIAPDALPFKWRDWTLSLGMDYNPTTVPSSTAREWWYDWRMKRAARRDGLAPSGRLANREDAAGLVADFRRRYGEPKASPPASAPQQGPWHKHLLRQAARLDGLFLGAAVKALSRAAEAPPQLSPDAGFRQQTDRLMEAVQTFVRVASTQQVPS